MTAPKAQIKEDVISRVVGGKAILLDPQTDELRHLNEPASLIWSLLLDGPRAAAELEAALLEEFDVDAATARADVAALLATLRAAGFLE
ncbi:PqqD family peptide modification chaperone [Myxococcota bacterium]|nr:PqqD family peptide modification chaperone [Myxococcota bacterium]MBU1430124.1 PqqD family peptide modification chaperone [Myxococcota bacterium]MBU1896471.1 PqqD family peptide modification chaperone [Myxococcota bacterium]